MTTMADLTTPCPPNWCPGCGNLSIWAAFKNAAIQEGWDNFNTVMVAGIGCHGHIVNFTKITSFEGLHGRPLPVATGIKLANNELNVFAFSGDGDCFGEGGNHFIHACRRNHDITVVVHDNGLYALTTGQTSPLTKHDQKTKSTPDGNPDTPFSPLTLAIASGATFVARIYAGDIKNLQKTIIEANNHKGFSFIDILQPCTTFNHVCTHQFYQQHTYMLGEDHDVTNKTAALVKSLEFSEKNIPCGVFYKVDTPSYESQIFSEGETALVTREPDNRNMDELFKQFT